MFKPVDPSNKFDRVLIICVVYPHELCHYVTARLLGVKAGLFWDRVKLYQRVRGWHWVVICLAPGLAGFGGQALATWWGWQQGIFGLDILALAGNLLWQLTCLRDYRQAWHYVRYREILPAEALDPMGRRVVK